MTKTIKSVDADQGQAISIKAHLAWASRHGGHYAGIPYHDELVQDGAYFTLYVPAELGSYAEQHQQVLGAAIDKLRADRDVKGITIMSVPNDWLEQNGWPLNIPLANNRDEVAPGVPVVMSNPSQHQFSAAERKNWHVASEDEKTAFDAWFSESVNADPAPALIISGLPYEMMSYEQAIGRVKRNSSSQVLINPARDDMPTHAKRGMVQGEADEVFDGSLVEADLLQLLDEELSAEEERYAQEEAEQQTKPVRGPRL